MQPPAYPGGGRPGVGGPTAGGGYPAAPPGAPVAYSPPPAPPALARPKRRYALRFLAGTCVATAWVTLVLSVVLALAAFAGAAGSAAMGSARPAATYFPPPSPPPGILPGQAGYGLPDPAGAGSEAAGLLTGLRLVVPRLLMASGIAALVTGLVSFLLFLGLGQVCYVLLDLEERVFGLRQAVDRLAMRPGGPR